MRDRKPEASLITSDLGNWVDVFDRFDTIIDSIALSVITFPAHVQWLRAIVTCKHLYSFVSMAP